MHAIESRLVSIMRPGEMLRFLLTPGKDGRLLLDIEGDGPEPGRFESRISAVLQAARRDGYEFRSASTSAQRNSSRAAKRGSLIEIVPRTKQLSHTRGHFGFRPSASGQDEPETTIFLPDFPIAAKPQVADYPFSLLVAEKALRRMEVEFVRWSLPDRCMKDIGRAFDRHAAEMTAILGADAPPATAMRAFLGLWLFGKSGSEIRCRVELNSVRAMPEGLLEVLGRELFGAECDLVVRGTGASRTARDAGIDLSFRYPDGWTFPSMLPPPRHLETLDAERIHNLSLPVLPKKGTVIGTIDGGEVRLPIETRDRHTYIVGATGTGKSTLLRRMIRDDIARGEGVILIDPHGDLYNSVLASIPARRRKDVFLLDPSSQNAPPGLNILDLPQGRIRRRHADFLIGELLRFFEEVWDMRNAGGPVFEMYFRNTLLLMCLQNPPAESVGAGKNADSHDQLLDCLRQRVGQLAVPKLNMGHFMRVMADQKFREQLLARCSDPTVVEFWKEVAAKTSGDYRLENFVPYVSCKVNGLTQGGVVAQLLRAERNEFRLGERMDRGEIVLLNLNKGQIGAYESRLLGTILMMEIFAAGLQRSLRPPTERRPVNIYVDEFQNFVSDNVASMLSEARKFGLRLTLANQTLAQLRTNSGKQDLLETVLGNVGNMILFRLGVPDAERLRLFLEPFSPREMQELPNFHALVRILTSSGPIRPVVMRTLK